MCMSQVSRGTAVITKRAVAPAEVRAPVAEAPAAVDAQCADAR